MAEKCAIDCEEVSDLKKILYGDNGMSGVIACQRKKVSWKQLGITVGIVVTFLGLVYGAVDFSRAGAIEKVDARCDSNEKNIQTFSVNQAVITDQRETAIEAQEEMHEDIQAIEININTISEKQIAETARTKKVDDVILRKLNKLIEK